MDRQIFRDFEVIVAADKPAELIAYDQWYTFTPRQKSPNDVWNINKAYNDCLDRAEGELLVFLQDFIWIPDDGLLRFWEAYEKYPTALVSGVGHKAAHGHEGISEEDRRMYGPPGLTLCDYMQIAWELNWASCPRAIMPRFEERMDAYYGGENLYIQRKAVLNGALMAIDRSNRCIAYSQEECGGRPDNWEEMHCNKEGRLAAFLHSLDLQYGTVTMKASGKGN
jgi:hypothetical protein